MQENKTLRRIAEQLGPEEILCQCAEECSELAQAVLKMRRALVGTTPLTQGEARALINEEVADVLNCVEALEAISIGGPGPCVADPGREAGTVGQADQGGCDMSGMGNQCMGCIYYKSLGACRGGD